MPGMLANKTELVGDRKRKGRERAVKDNNKLQLLHANCWES